MTTQETRAVTYNDEHNETETQEEPIMPIFTNQKSLTQKRAEYADSLIATMVDTVARDLHKQATTREVGVAALARIITAVAPNSGKGHATAMREYTNKAVDRALERMQEQVVDMHAPSKPQAVKKAAGGKA